MNLSPVWERWFSENEYEAVHWSRVGDASAPDTAIMDWARDNERVVFTNDLDFGTSLALTNAAGPSVLQARTLDVRPPALGPSLRAAIEQTSDQLVRGAIVIIDADRMRMRVLPLRG